MEPSRDIPTLLGELAASSVSLRQRAASALGKAPVDRLTAHPGTASALQQALMDSNKYVRASAAAALTRMQPQNVLGLTTLEALLADPHRDVRAAAVLALGELGPLAKRSAPALAAVSQDPHPSVRMRAAEALAKIIGVGT